MSQYRTISKTYFFQHLLFEESKVLNNMQIYKHCFLFFLSVHKHCRICLRVPWTARSNQSILKEINAEYSLERLMLKLKLQYSGHLMGRANSLEKTLLLGKIEDKRKRGWQRMRRTWFSGHEFEQTLGDSEGQGSLACCSPWDHKESDTTEWLNWIELNCYTFFKLFK